MPTRVKWVFTLPKSQFTWIVSSVSFMEDLSMAVRLQSGRYRSNGEPGSEQLPVLNFMGKNST